MRIIAVIVALAAALLSAGTASASQGGPGMIQVPCFNIGYPAADSWMCQANHGSAVGTALVFLAEPRAYRVTLIAPGAGNVSFNAGLGWTIGTGSPGGILPYDPACLPALGGTPRNPRSFILPRHGSGPCFTGLTWTFTDSPQAHPVVILIPSGH